MYDEPNDSLYFTCQLQACERMFARLPHCQRRRPAAITVPRHKIADQPIDDAIKMSTGKGFTGSQLDFWDCIFKTLIWIMRVSITVHIENIFKMII